MRKILMGVMGFSLLATTSAFASGGTAHWGYSGEGAPEHWGDLSPEFAACKSGKNQSPIDITGLIESELAPIAFSYGDSKVDVVNNGHTIKASYDPGSSITVDGQTFNLLQVHFHSPSENTINGKSFPLEAHFVHADANSNLAVIGVMYEEGKENPALVPIWAAMPEKSGETLKGEGQISAMAMMPANKDYYRFNGSLTTPPCSEGVRWMVIKESASVSADQVKQFYNRFHHDTNRPVQPINARPVLK